MNNKIPLDARIQRRRSSQRNFLIKFVENQYRKTDAKGKPKTKALVSDFVLFLFGYTLASVVYVVKRGSRRPSFILLLIKSIRKS